MTSRFPRSAVEREAEAARVLGKLVGGLTYKAGWHFELRGPTEPECPRGLGWRLLVKVQVADSTEGHQINLVHTLPIPSSYFASLAGDRRKWRRYLFERVSQVERHETMEFFKIDGEAPFFPDHDVNPYALVDRTSMEADQRA